LFQGSSSLAAVSRLAVPVTLQNRERRPPALRIGGRKHRIEHWVSGEHAGAWLSAVVADVRRLRPGSYEVELVFERNPPYRTRLERLPSPLQ
jgi:hypothetical protein